MPLHVTEKIQNWQLLQEEKTQSMLCSHDNKTVIGHSLPGERNKEIRHHVSLILCQRFALGQSVHSVQQGVQ